MPHAAAAMVSCLQKAESMERGAPEEIWKETGRMRGRAASGDSKPRGARANQFLQRRETTYWEKSMITLPSQMLIRAMVIRRRGTHGAASKGVRKARKKEEMLREKHFLFCMSIVR